MNIYNRHSMPWLPAAIVYQPSCLTSMPTSAEVNDVWGNGGSGIGSGSEAIRSAMGEYFERRHFYMEIASQTKGILGKTLTPFEIQSFVSSFTQTTEIAKSYEEICKHEFYLSEVYRAHDFVLCMVPTACVSLSAYGIENDTAVYPRRDTCGCSFHWDPAAAIFGSLKEQLERQFLLRFWLTKICRERVSPNFAAQALKSARSYNLYKLLTTSGQVTVLDISDTSFPGVCLLTVYGSQDQRHVKYCAGMAYAETFSEALDKSIRELWQTFRFIDVFRATEGKDEEIADCYLRHFLECNKYETYQEIIDVLAVNGLAAPNKEKFECASLLSKLEKLGINGFFYLKPIIHNKLCHYACKYFSPDLFMHMNSSANINLSNKYSQSFINSINSDRAKTMVPFP